jgi:hypothetical protein
MNNFKLATIDYTDLLSDKGLGEVMDIIFGVEIDYSTEVGKAILRARRKSLKLYHYNQMRKKMTEAANEHIKQAEQLGDELRLIATIYPS